MVQGLAAKPDLTIMSNKSGVNILKNYHEFTQIGPESVA